MSAVQVFSQKIKTTVHCYNYMTSLPESNGKVATAQSLCFYGRIWLFSDHRIPCIKFCSGDVFDLNTSGVTMNIKSFTLVGIILALATFRLLPHLPNVSPIAAMALFGGAYYADKRLALLIPFVALFVTDLILGFHNTMLFVYLGFALSVWAGMWLGRHLTPVNTVMAALLSSTLFFVLTNFGVWLMSDGLYPSSVEGLLQAYIAGLPFYQYTLMGDLVYVSLIFGGYELFRQNLSARPA